MKIIIIGLGLIFVPKIVLSRYLQMKGIKDIL